MKEQQIKRSKPAVQAFPEIEARFQHIADTAPVMIWMSGLDKGCIYFNQRWLEFTGKQLEEELGDGWSRGVHPDDLKRCLGTYTGSFERQDAFTMEYRLRRCDGEYRWILDNGVPHFDANGMFAGFVGSCVDIHSRKVGEELSHDSVDELLALINSTDDLICSRDREGALRIWNDAFAASIKTAFGVDPFVGMRTVEYLDPEQRANFSRFSEVYSRVLAGERIREDYVYRMPTGQENFYEVVFSPLGSGNEIVGVTEITRNVTDKRRKEIAIERSNQRFSAFIRNSAEDIYCFEFDQPLDVTLSEEEQIDHFYKYGYVAEANDSWARSAGYQQGQDLVGFRFEQFLPRSKPESIDTLKRFISAQYCLEDLESVEVYETGVTRHVLNNVVGVAENGRLVRIWGTGRDITKQKQLEKELLGNETDLQKLAGRLISSQEKELRRLSRELHDDLTQQLAVMAIEAGNVERQFEDLPESVLQIISSIKDRLIKASENVHTLARNLHPSILDDLGLVRAVKTECRHFSSRMGVETDFMPKNIPEVISEDISLSVYRIIQEGLANIAKHADTKNACVFLEGFDDSMILTIRDTGIGFSPEEVRLKEGLGLGSIRERVRLVNGTLSITSSPGQGTTLKIIIPLKGESND